MDVLKVAVANRCARIALALVVLLAACEKRDEHSMTPLMYAARRGDTIEIKRQLDGFADTETAVKPHNTLRVMVAFMAWMQELPDRNPGWTALMFAVDSLHYDAVRVLLDHGANPSVDANGLTPLDVAMFKADARIVHLLVSRGAQPNPERMTDPLIFAATRNDTTLVRMLLALGANVNGTNRGGVTPLMAAAESGAAATVELLLARGANPAIKGRNNWSAARFALEKGHTQVADRLGAGHEKLNAELFHAIDARDVAGTFALIAKGADINALDEGGRSALLRTVDRFPEDAVLRYIDAGARVQPDEAGPILYLSVWFGYENLFDRMIEAGARPRDSYVTDAVRNRQIPMIKKLLAMGMDPNAVDAMRRSAFELARLRKDEEILEILEKGAIKERGAARRE